MKYDGHETIIMNYDEIWNDLGCNENGWKMNFNLCMAMNGYEYELK